jgi:hypothetical protein
VHQGKRTGSKTTACMPTPVYIFLHLRKKNEKLKTVPILPLQKMSERANRQQQNEKVNYFRSKIFTEPEVVDFSGKKAQVRA